MLCHDLMALRYDLALGRAAGKSGRSTLKNHELPSAPGRARARRGLTRSAAGPLAAARRQGPLQRAGAARAQRRAAARHRAWPRRSGRRLGRRISPLKGERTGAALIAAMQASPYRDIDIEPKRDANARARGRSVTGWLLDTNILSELRRPKPEPKVARLRRRATARSALRQRRDLRRNPLRH